MKAPTPPRLDGRRAAEFAAELRARAEAWIPSWSLADGEGDVGRALLDIAARFSAEVVERLDRAGEKMQRGFLDWLAVRGEAARSARMPVVLKLAEKAQAVLARHPVRMQVDTGGTSVMFETETDVRVVPGSLKVVVGADADGDAFFLPAPGLSDLEPLDPLPTQWQLKSFASTGAQTLQVDPDTGLAAEMIVEAAGRQYRVVTADSGIVTLDPGLEEELAVGAMLRKVSSFDPFDDGARNRQEHALYLGHTELLDIEAAATLEVVGATDLATGVGWQYWGKVDPGDLVGWQSLEQAAEQDQQPDALVLLKPKGSVELREVGKGNNSRWIRAFRKTATGEPFRVDELGIRVNAESCRKPAGCPAVGEAEFPAAEAMANTTPLVLDNVFFPLGKEPRQFDAFYLGSKEAFSKQGAQVQLCFEMADPNFEALAALHGGPKANTFVAGVAADGYLHLLSFSDAGGALGRFGNREPIRPPSPGPAGAPVEGPPVDLDPRPDFRPPVWAVGSDLFTAVTAKGAVWIWRENTVDTSKSGWESAGDVTLAAGNSQPVTGLVYLADGAAGRLFALCNARLFVRNLNVANTGWDPVTTKSGGNDIQLAKIVAIGVETTELGGGTLTEGLVGIGVNEKLYAIMLAGSPLTGTCQKLLDDAASDIAPAAVRRNDNRLVVVAVGMDQAKRKLLGFRSTAGTLTPSSTPEVELDIRGVIGHSVDCNLDAAGALTFVLSVRLNLDTAALAVWTPYDATQPTVLFTTIVPAHVGIPTGAPTLTPWHVLVPTTTAQVIVAPFDLTHRFAASELLETAVITSETGDQLVPGDWLAIPVATPGIGYQLVTVGVGVEYRGQTLYGFPGIQAIDDDLLVYRAAGTQRTAAVSPTALNLMTINATDAAVVTGAPVTGGDIILLITANGATDLYAAQFNPVTRVATLDRNLPGPMPAPPVTYQVPEVAKANLLPLLRLVPPGTWEAALLDRVRLLFPGADPELQSGVAFKVTADGHPELVALSEQWSIAPALTAGKVSFTVDGSVGAWSAQLGDALTNPELSWEYWNGKGWWGLDAIDGTRRLRMTGVVQFDVPADLASSDWAGKTNYWIRARLVGGDYGRERVTVTTKDLGGGVTEQTVNRSSESIRAPSVLRLSISYRLCEGVQPTFVLTQDSGSLRDQSDANRTAGAIVEAFVPLAVTLGRLSSSLALSPAPDCPPGCRSSEIATANGDAVTAPIEAAPPAAGRALFIGLDAAPDGAPVNLLLLVDAERPHDRFAPMTVEAFVADRFVPLIAADATRALGESGLLSLSFPVEPTPRDLFGQTLRWLRLTAAPGAAVADWRPALRGAYLNAVWAGATETLTRELVGSSEGAPDLTLYLARPPVLHDTLELRVREPLGEEERKQLRDGDPTRVLSDVPDLAGDWVRWEQVTDPLDELPGARVYAHDESIGEIRFGNWENGMIPPIGRDSIVAFTYQRTEPGQQDADVVPANAITARTPLNLVSPVESVEAVVVADQAAGGAPPESPDRVVRFGSAHLRHRGRAVTARDLEDLTLESSPDIVQARAFPRRGSVRLVVVMKGSNPVPGAERVRELERELLAAAPLSLSARQVLRIGGPSLRRLRVVLELRVETLDQAGALTEDAQRLLTRLFDSGRGGPDGDGWPLGANPGEDDIALALLDAPGLAGIGSVTLLEIGSDGLERPWPTALDPTDLVVLADDPVRIQFTTVMVIQ